MMDDHKGPEPADYLTAAKILLLREFPDEEAMALSLPKNLFEAICPMVPIDKHNELAGAICAAVEQSI